MRSSVGFDLSQCQEKLSYQAQECRKALSRPIPRRQKKPNSKRPSPFEALQPSSIQIQHISDPTHGNKDTKPKKADLITIREVVPVLPPQKHDFVVTAPLQDSAQEVDLTVDFYPAPAREKAPPLSSVEVDSHVDHDTVEQQPSDRSSVDVAHLRADLDTYKDVISMLMTDFRLMKAEFDELKQERHGKRFFCLLRFAMC